MDNGIFNEVQFISPNMCILMEGSSAFDIVLDSFIKKSDNKELKQAMTKVIEVNSLSDKEFRENPNNIMDVAFKAMKATLDSIESETAKMGKSTVYGNIGKVLASSGAKLDIKRILLMILGFIAARIVARVLRLCVDKIESSKCKKSARNMVKILRNKANKTNDDEVKEKYISQANELEKAINKINKRG